MSSHDASLSPRITSFGRTAARFDPANRMRPLGAWLEQATRLLRRRIDVDGRALALAPPPLDLKPPIVADGGQGRRDRRFGLPQDILERSLSQKVLHGWLQNRHQVLVPLTFRLGQLRADDLELLMRFAAASMLAASTPDDAARDAVERWLRTIGAEDAAILVFRRALAAPSALSTLVEGAKTRRLEAYAFVIANMATDLREASGRLYADFIAARLNLPADAVRSISRRYRR